MKQDQTGKIWKDNQMIGYIDEDTGALFGINPKTGFAEKISNDVYDATGQLFKWRKPLLKLMK